MPATQHLNLKGDFKATFSLHFYRFYTRRNDDLEIDLTSISFEKALTLKQKPISLKSDPNYSLRCYTAKFMARLKGSDFNEIETKAGDRLDSYSVMLKGTRNLTLFSNLSG